MRPRDVDPLIARAGRLDRATLEREGLEAVSAELLTEILSEPRGPSASESTTTPDPSERRAWRGHPVRLAATAAAAAVVVVLAMNVAGQHGTSPAPALAAERAQIAAVSPHVLLAEPGWQIEAASQKGGLGGMIKFLRGDGATSLSEWLPIDVLGRAELDWRSNRSGPFPGAASDPVPRIRAAVLGTAASVSVRAVPGVAPAEYEATWIQGDRQVRFRSFAGSLEQFERRLGSLRVVDRRTWLNALPLHPLGARGWAALARR